MSTSAIESFCCANGAGVGISVFLNYFFVLFNNIYTSTTATVAEEQVNVQPGLTSGGQPTTQIANSVAYSDINIDDNWAEIVQILDA